MDLLRGVGGLNQAINFEKGSIFIAIPKSGSSTIRQQIVPKGPYLVPAPHLNVIQLRDLIKTYFLLASLGQNSAFPTQDLPTHSDIIKQADKTFAEFFKFAGVRNPWARAVSLYFRREGVQVADSMSFERFCEQHIYASDTCVWPTLHKNQIDWIVDEEGRVIVDYFFKIEEFHQKLEEIRSVSGGRVILKNFRLNDNPKSLSHVYQDIYTERSKKFIEKNFEKDIDFFRYTF